MRPAAEREHPLPLPDDHPLLTIDLATAARLRRAADQLGALQATTPRLEHVIVEWPESMLRGPIDAPLGVPPRYAGTMSWSMAHCQATAVSRIVCAGLIPGAPQPGVVLTDTPNFVSRPAWRARHFLIARDVDRDNPSRTAASADRMRGWLVELGMTLHACGWPPSQGAATAQCTWLLALHHTAVLARQGRIFTWDGYIGQGAENEDEAQCDEEGRFPAVWGGPHEATHLRPIARVINDVCRASMLAIDGILARRIDARLSPTPAAESAASDSHPRSVSSPPSDRALKEPHQRAVKAYRLCFLMQQTTRQAAATLSHESGEKVGHGTISKWVRQVTKYIEAGGVLPQSHRSNDSPMPRTRTLAPGDLERGSPRISQRPREDPNEGD